MSFAFEQEDGLVAICTKQSSIPAGAAWIAVASYPDDKQFRSAWRIVDGELIEDLEVAKLVMHDARRALRAAELAPLDIEATIPARAEASEIARQAIRDASASLQIEIDAAVDVAALRAMKLVG